MPVFTPNQFVKEDFPAKNSDQPNQNLWISEAGALTQFGAFIDVLQPGSRSSIKHWHSAEDEMIYVLEGEITVVEGSAESVLRTGDAATFKAGVAIGHYLENRGNSASRCLVVGTRSSIDRITYPDLDRVCHRDRSEPDDIWTNLSGETASNPYDQ